MSMPDLEPTMQTLTVHDALEQALAGWRAVECHPPSISVPLCPLTTPGQSLH